MQEHCRAPDGHEPSMMPSETKQQFVGRWRVFDVVVFCALALLNLNMVGPDPGDFLFPFLLVTGLFLGYLHLRDLRFSSALKLFFFGFIVFYAISNIAGRPVSAALGHLASNIALFCFLKLYVVSTQRMRRVLAAILFGAVASSALAVAAMLRVWNPPKSIFFPVFEEKSGRFSALLSNPPILALLSVFLAIWLLDEVLKPKLWRGSTGLKVMLLVLALFQVAVTVTRSGWLNLAVALICYSLIELKRRRPGRKVVIVAMVLIATLGGLALVPGSAYRRILQDRIKSFVNPTVYGYDESDRMRFYYTIRAIDLAGDNPWGLGSGRTETLFQSELTGLNLGAHNAYVQIMSDNGWGTFLFFMSILGCIGLAVIRKMIKHDESHFGFSYQVLFSGLAGLAVEGMFHDLIGWNLAWILPSFAAISLWPAIQRKTVVVKDMLPTTSSLKRHF